MDTDVLYSLLAEVAQGIGAAKSAVTDSPEVRAMRAVLVEQCHDITDRGHAVDVPQEWPSVG
jgi:hypothetical protein